MANSVPAPAEDVARLREALAWIGDADLDLSLPRVDLDDDDMNDQFLWSLLAEPFEPDSPIVPSAAIEMDTHPSRPWPSTRATTTDTGNRCRNKRRQEIVSLRERIRILETRLTHMEQHGKEARREVLEDAADHSPTSTILRKAWAEIAMRQLDQRRRAESENKKLKRLLQDQIHVGKSLERLLRRKRLKVEDAVLIEKRVRSPPWNTTHEVFQELVASTNRQYSETSRVVAPVLARDGKRELARTDERGVVLQTTESRILPFAYELAAHEFWHAMPMISNAKTDDADKLRDLLTTQFRAAATFGRKQGDLNVYMVKRRFREPQRTVFVCSRVIDPAEIVDRNLSGVSVRHKGWIVLEPVAPDDSKSSTTAATRMTLCFVTVPQLLAGRLDDQAVADKVDALAHFFMSALNIELDSHQQAFENRLVRRAATSTTTLL